MANEFGVSRDFIHRHFKNHVSDRRRAEPIAGPARVEGLANAAAAAESKSLLEYLGITRSVLFNQFLICAEAGDHNGVSTVAGRLIESLRELGRVTGELRQLSGVTINNTLNIVSSPGFIALQDGFGSGLGACAPGCANRNRATAPRPRGQRRGVWAH